MDPRVRVASAYQLRATLDKLSLPVSFDETILDSRSESNDREPARRLRPAPPTFARADGAGGPRARGDRIGPAAASQLRPQPVPVPSHEPFLVLGGCAARGRCARHRARP